MELKGINGGPLLIGHLLHNDGDLVSANQQSATLSNRPSTFNVTQTAEALTYSASAPIGTITYGGNDEQQRNAIRLNGLPSSFQITLGDTVGYVASTPMESIEVQLTNATQPLTMDGDHFRFLGKRNLRRSQFEYRHIRCNQFTTPLAIDSWFQWTGG